MRAIVDRFLSLRKDEQGQSFVFGVLSIFLVLFFAAMVVAVGRVSARRIQLQFAADSAAYSSALVESECLNSAALLNTGMAQVRARALRHAADVNVYGVLAEMRDRLLGMNQRLSEALATQIQHLQSEIEQEDDPERRRALERELDYLTARQNSLHVDGDPEQELLEVTDEAFWRQQIDAVQAALREETNPVRREELRQQLAYLEDMLSGLSVEPGSDPTWVQETVGIDRADQEYVESYARASRWLPASNQWLREMSRLEYTIAILAPHLAAETAYRVASDNGGEYVSVFPCSRWLPRDDAYLTVEVWRLGNEWWRVEGGGTTLEVQMTGCGTCQGCNGCGDCQKCWIVTGTQGVTQQGKYRICQLEDRRWFVRDMVREESICIRQTEHFQVVTWGPEGIDVVYHREYDPMWIELINRQGEFPQNRLFVRRYENTVQQARYKWDPEVGEWVMPDEQDFVSVPPGTVTVDGVRISVTLDPVIVLPGSARVRVLEPEYFDFVDDEGQTWARAWLHDTTYFEATINSVGVRVHGEDFSLWKGGERLWRNSADGRWRTHFDRIEDYWWQHRLTQTQPNVHWLYEFMEFGARMEPERNMARLMAHRDVDLTGLPDDEFATAACLPSWAYDPEMNPAGWLDASDGGLVPDDVQGDYEHAYKYYQVRPCWDPWCDGGEWWFDYNHDGHKDAGETTTCPVCSGRDYVVVEPSDVFGRLGLGVRDEGNPPRAVVQEDDYQQTGFQAQYTPLVLSEDFFKFGFTAGVWHRREEHFPRGEVSTTSVPDRPVEYLLHDPNPGMKGLLRGPAGVSARERGEVKRPRWGYFTAAASRPRINRPGESGGWGGLEHGVYFTDLDERERWIEENLNNLYMRACAGGWSYWDARLVALNRQVLDEDVILGQAEPAETGLGWLMTRIAYGSPGGLLRSRQESLPPTYSRYGNVTGWTRDIYGGFDETYHPTQVMRDLTIHLRPRAPYPSMGGAYVDEEGLLRDPFVEYLSGKGQGELPRGGQLDYHALDSDSVVH